MKEIDKNKSANQSPEYNVAMAMANENKRQRAKKKKQAIAGGVIGGIAFVTAIVVPTVYFNSPVDISVDIPGIGETQQYEMSIKRGFKIGDLTPKEIEGYTFEGFYRDSNLTEKYGDEDKIDKNTTIYAKYTVNIYDITFPTSNYFTIQGENIEDNKVYAEYNTEYSFTISLSQGYTQSDITVMANGEEITPVGDLYTITVKGDMAITVSGVEINTYSVVYYDEDGETIIHSEEVDYNTASQYYIIPTKPADNTYTYTFAGWVYYDSGEAITNELDHVISNIKVKAKYTAKYIEYSIANIPSQVSIKQNGELLSSRNTLHYGDQIEITYTASTGYDMTTFEIEGATLVGENIYRVTGDISIEYAETIQTFTISIMSNNDAYGTVSETSLTLDYGTTYVVEGDDLVLSTGQRITPTATTSNAEYTYAFTGWSSSAGTITSDETITANFTQTLNTYRLTIENADSAYGAIDSQGVTLPYGTTYRVEGNRLIFDTEEEIVITATPNTNTAQYTYTFTNWSVDSGKVTGNDTITAHFERTVNKYTVSIVTNNIEYGSVNIDSVVVEYGTEIDTSVFGELHIGDYLITATPSIDTPTYDYTFVNWTNAVSEVTGDITITANFEQTMDEYVVSIEVNSADYGSVDTASITVHYDTPITVEGNTITIDGTKITATPKENNAQYTYSFVDWTNATDSITGDRTITANFDRVVNEYEVSIQSNNTTFGSVDTTSVTVPYGTTISVEDNVLTFSDGNKVTAIPADRTQQYTYSISDWTIESNTVTGEQTIVANFIQVINEYTVTFVANNAFGKIDTASVTVPYNTTFIVDGSTIRFGTGEEINALPSTDDAQYSYEFAGWDVESGFVTDTLTITANFTQALNEYIITIASSEYGSVDEDSVTVPYGTTYHVEGNTLVFDTEEEIVVTATPNEKTAQYTYAFSNWSSASGTVEGATTITAHFDRTVNSYTVSIQTNNAEYGTVDVDSVIVEYGTAITVDKNVLTIGSQAITATTALDNPTYNYTFVNWSNTVSEVTGDITITANFERTMDEYVVSIVTNNADYGSVDRASITVNYNTPIIVNNNKISINGTEITAIANQNTAQYTYEFAGWEDVADPITSNRTITAIFTRVVNEYAVTIQINNSAYGTVNTNKITVPYGTGYEAIQNRLIFSDGATTTVTATPNMNTAEYTYTFSHWSTIGGVVEGDITIIANFTSERNSYTVTIANGNSAFGSIDNASVTVPYGTTFTAQGNILVFSDGSRVTANPASATAQYSYSFSHWSVNSGTIIGAQTITAYFNQTVNNYNVTFIINNINFGDVNISSISVSYNTTYIVSGNTIRFGSGDVITATPSANNAQYSYSFAGWNVSESGFVTGAMTITASFTQTVNNYTVTINRNNTGYGSVSSSSISVPYGTTWSASDNTLSFNNGTKITASPTSSSAQYTYSFSSWTNASGTVTGATTITANFSQSVNNYTVRFSSGNSAYGTVSTGSISVPYGTTYSVSGNTISFNNGASVTANPNSATAQYTYSFTGWSSNNGTITGNASLSASFTATVNNYTITFETNLGTLSQTSLVVPYGTTFRSSYTALYFTTPDGQEYTITLKKPRDTALFRYVFAGWSVENGTVEDSMTIIATVNSIKKDPDDPKPILPEF